MVTLCFYFEDAPPVLYYSSSCPQIGDTISLSEFDGNLGPLEVIDVIGDEFDNPRVGIRVHQRESNPVVLASGGILFSCICAVEGNYARQACSM